MASTVGGGGGGGSGSSSNISSSINNKITRNALIVECGTTCGCA